MPDIEALSSQLHYLGDVVSFTPFHAMLTACSVSSDRAPLLHDFRVAGERTLPVSVALEYAVRGAEWVQPPGRVALHLHEIRHLDCRLSGLAAPAGQCSFARKVIGSGTDSAWTVHVSLTAGGETVLRAELIYSARPRTAGAAVSLPRGTSMRLPDRADLRWVGRVFELAAWNVSPVGTLVAAVRPSAPADAWATVIAAGADLPVCHIENALRAAASLTEHAGVIERLQAGRIQFFDSGSAVHLAGADGGRNWQILDGTGRTAVHIADLRFDTVSTVSEESEDERAALAR
jgi:hypothetical protein